MGFHPELLFVIDGVSPAGSGAVCQWHTSSTDRSGSVDRVRTVPTGDLPPAARSWGAAPHPEAFEKGKTSRSEVYETFPIFSRHLRAAFFLLYLPLSPRLDTPLFRLYLDIITDFRYDIYGIQPCSIEKWNGAAFIGEYHDGLREKLFGFPGAGPF